MIRLGALPHGWLDLLPGVRGFFDPITRPMVRAARRASAQFYAENVGLDEQVARDGAGDAFTAELIRQGLKDWEGVGNAAGDPLAVTDPGAIEAFIAEPLLFEAADNKWVLPWAVQASEKNASSPSLAGTSKAATGAKTTAASPAKPARKADRPGTAAANARTGSTPRKRTKAKPSGK